MTTLGNFFVRYFIFLPLLPVKMKKVRFTFFEYFLISGFCAVRVLGGCLADYGSLF